MHLYCCSHDGGQKNAYQPIFPCNIIEISLTCLDHNSVLVLMTSNLIHRHVVWSDKPDQNLGQMDHNFHGFLMSYANHQ